MHAEHELEISLKVDLDFGNLRRRESRVKGFERNLLLIGPLGLLIHDCILDIVRTSCKGDKLAELGEVHRFLNGIAMPANEGFGVTRLFMI